MFPAAQPTQGRPINLGNWELVGHVLRPTHKHLQAYVSKLAITSTDDLLFFELPDGSTGTAKDPRTMHASRLAAASAPLRALAIGPFVESHTRRVPFQESAQAFRIIRRFVYCQMIDMRDVALDFVFVADRWDLLALFHACFELAPQAFQREKDQSIQKFVNRCFPLLESLQVPKKFCRFFAFRLALSMDNLGEDFSRQLFPWLFSETGNTQADPKKRKIAELVNGDDVKKDLLPSTGDDGANMENSTSAPFSQFQNRNLGYATGVKAVSYNDLVGSGSHNSCSLATGKFWPVLIGKDMLRFIVHYSERFTEQSHCSDLMQLVMQELEPYLSDEDLEGVLRQFEWQSWRCARALRSRNSVNWPLRSWRQLALMDHNRRRPYREETHMVWTCANAGNLLRGSHVSVSFEKRDYFNGHEVLFGLRCHGWGPREKGLFLSIRLAHCETCCLSDEDDCGGCESECSTDFWARVNVVENGCECTASRFREFQGRVAGNVGFDRSKMFTISPGGDDEVRIEIMDAGEFALWKMCHKGDCGLIFGMRLWSVSWAADY